MLVLETQVNMLGGLAFAPDGTAIAAAGTGVPTGGPPHGLSVWPIAAGRPRWASRTSGHPCSVVRFLTADRLSVGGRAVFNANTGKCVRPAPTDDPDQRLGASADGRLVLTGVPAQRAITQQIRQPNGRTRTEHVPALPARVTLRSVTRAGAVADVWAAEIGTDNLGPAAVCGDRAALAPAYGDRVWLLEANGTTARTLDVPRVVGVALADDRLLAFTRSHLYVWELADPDRPPLVVYGGPHERLDAVAVHPDGKRAFLTNFARTVLTVDLRTGALGQTMDWGVPLLSSIAVSPDGTLAAAGNHGGQVVVWDLDE